MGPGATLLTFSATILSPTCSVGYIDNDGMKRSSATNRNTMDAAIAVTNAFASSAVMLSQSVNETDGWQIDVALMKSSSDLLVAVGAEANPGAAALAAPIGLPPLLRANRSFSREDSAKPSTARKMDARSPMATELRCFLLNWVADENRADRRVSPDLATPTPMLQVVVLVLVKTPAVLVANECMVSDMRVMVTDGEADAAADEAAAMVAMVSCSATARDNNCRSHNAATPHRVTETVRKKREPWSHQSLSPLMR
eukprot:TRINITY_DN3028_c0_g1_i2.p1 TRINITY_DN3028_c0_g1~~TRINITY_DN3028_c0_g1_i2.p1  ORF type:complete len:255 (+),score=12.16 TRINITY_DN3028_c0_g1_i2:1143-1907(+)